MSKREINQAFIDIINSVDIYAGRRIKFSYGLRSLELLDKYNFEIRKDTEDYVYGDYGELKENEGDLYLIAIISPDVNKHNIIKRGVNRYQISKNITNMGEEYFTVFFYQKYKKKSCARIYVQADIKRVLERDSFIDNILL